MPSSPPPITFSSLARGRVSFEIVAQVTQAIAQGSIPLGSYLPTEPQLMAQFGVGRNALREAIKILEAFGLVTVRRGAGTYVQDSCTFDLLVPLFLRLLWLSPTKEDLQGAFQGLDHARALDPPTQGEESIFGQIVPLVRFLFRGCSPAVSQSPLPQAGEKQAASRQIFWQIIQDLADRKLRPGDKLPTEQDLMARFSVSRNVVREGVKALEAIGILEIRRPTGTFVPLENNGFPPFVDTAIYSHIFTHQGSQPFLRLKIALRDAVFYLACRNADPAQRAEFQARSARFAQLLQGENPSLESCAQALDQVNDYLSQLSGNPILQAIERVILDISVQSRNNFLANALQTGRQGEAAASYLWDAELLCRGDLEGVHSAMDRKLDLWLSLNIV